eukprot:3253671-Alexandrium_andersonii.AAC.1
MPPAPAVGVRAYRARAGSRASMRHRCTLRGGARAHGSAGHGGHLPRGHCGTRARVTVADQVPNACWPV